MWAACNLGVTACPQENVTKTIDSIMDGAQTAEARVRDGGSVVVDIWDGEGRGIRMIDGAFDTFLSVGGWKKK